MFYTLLKHGFLTTQSECRFLSICPYYYLAFIQIISPYLNYDWGYNKYRQLRNRKYKYVPCFYRVIETWVEVWNKKCCGNTSCRRVFEFVLNFMKDLSNVKGVEYYKYHYVTVDVTYWQDGTKECLFLKIYICCTWWKGAFIFIPCMPHCIWMSGEGIPSLW